MGAASPPDAPMSRRTGGAIGLKLKRPLDTGGGRILGYRIYMKDISDPSMCGKPQSHEVPCAPCGVVSCCSFASYRKTRSAACKAGTDASMCVDSDCDSSSATTYTIGYQNETNPATDVTIGNVGLREFGYRPFVEKTDYTFRVLAINALSTCLDSGHDSISYSSAPITLRTLAATSPTSPLS